jgi:hypothetical protein
MGIFSTFFSAHNYEAIKYIKIKTGFNCNSPSINFREMELVAVNGARDMDFNLPRILKRSPLTMVGEFRYLMNIYEGEQDTAAMEKIAQAITLFTNEHGDTLPIQAKLIFRGCMPTELQIKSEQKYGK